MHIHGQLNEEDYVAAQFLHMRPSLPYAITGVLLLVIMLVVCALDHSKESLIALAALAFFALMLFVYTPYRARRTFREYKALSEPVTYEIRDDGLYARREHGEGLVPWADLVKSKKNQKLILLYPARNIFYMLPQRLFGDAEQFESFALLVSNKLGKATRS